MTKFYFLHLFRLYYLCLRYSLGEVILSKRFHFLLWLNPFYLLSNRFIPRGKRLAYALQKAGPLFIKFGQILSTRQDILPEDITRSLVILQDKANPFSSKIARKIINQESNNLAHSIFKKIEHQSLASASIAQVHAATLNSGQEVVIKILKPNIKKLLIRDLALLHFGAKFFKPWGEKLVAEIDLTLKQEVNLLNEAAHAQQLKENLEKRQEKNVFVPKIYWEYCTENMLVIERIYGSPIMNIHQLKAMNINLHDLAKKCVESFFMQIFQDNYFHADLHPGNLFINTKDAKNPIIELIDFGIVGFLPFKDRRYIAENMTALIDKNYRKVAALHRESGWIPEYVPEIAFAYALEKICDPILNKPLKEISLAQLLLGLLRTAKQYEIQLQPQLLLLQKTLLNIESLCRHLDPNFNIWEIIQPILTDWLKNEMCPIKIIKLMVKNVISLIKQQHDSK